MKRSLVIVLLVLPFLSFGQWVVSYHQSNIPFISVGYEIKDKFRPELRINTDVFIENFSPELAFLYDLANREAYEFYVGLGGRVNNFGGVVVPVGFNFYPLSNNNFGFHIEIAPMLGEDVVIRGTWGIRYRFRK